MNMSSMQIVFLFDLNACADFLFSPKEELNRKLLSVRLACLRLLTEFSSKYSNLKWGTKFFDSQGSKNQTMCKLFFTDFSLENFETLENEICVRYERHLSILQALLESSQNSLSLSTNRITEETNNGLSLKILQLALTQVLCEFQWETMDMWSPSYTKIKKGRKNFLFVFSDFKDNDESLLNFFGLSNPLSKQKFLNLFLPQSLRDSIVKKADIHLVLLNMCEDQKFMGCFSSKILPLLCDTLHSVHGSFIPLSVLSQPLYDFKLLNDLESNICVEKKLLLSSLPIGYRNSFLTFSTLFEQSLYHPFYSATSTPIYDCCIDFANKNIKIPIQVIEISNKNLDIPENMSEKTTSSVKDKCPLNSIWSKLNAYCVVPRDAVFPVSKVLFCLPRSSESNALYTCGLQNLNNYLSVGGFNLLLECETEDGIKLPGLMNSLSCDTAVISIFDPSNTLKLECEFPDCIFSKYQDFQSDFLDKIKDLCDKNIDLLDNVAANSIFIPKPFQIQSLENKFKPEKLHSLTSQISNNSLKMKDYSNLLKKSIAKDRNLKLKQTKQPLTDDLKSNGVNQSKITDEKMPDAVPNCNILMKNFMELPPDISYEELLSAVRDSYNCAIESSAIAAITASEMIMKMVVNYCKKNNETSYEEHVIRMLKDNILINDQRCITQKYEALDSKVAAEKIIKECQIQILLNLEMESLKLIPDKFGCVSTVTSLLRTAEFYFMFQETIQLGGLKERRIFLNEVLKKKYEENVHENLHDILQECIQEFEESESSPGSPETISSEFNNEEELFSSVISSNLSEKSTSSTGSCINNKDAKNKKSLERKLLRRRSDLSDTVRYRQVLLPKSSPKKKKVKAVRYSPRLAAKKSGNNKSVCEKTNKARRNLFSGDKAFRTPKKNDNLSTPKSKKKNFVSKNKLASETPAHKQNYSALQRRKSFMEQSNSPKVIAESPTIRETAKDAASKELLEKLLKERQLSNAAREQKPQLLTFKDRTPESKRRLSLKLFSKFLHSPTARQGIKKCTKRLFDQISPKKSVESCKKFKASDETEKPLNLFTKDETHS